MVKRSEQEFRVVEEYVRVRHLLLSCCSMGRRQTPLQVLSCVVLRLHCVDMATSRSSGCITVHLMAGPGVCPAWVPLWLLHQQAGEEHSKLPLGRLPLQWCCLQPAQFAARNSCIALIILADSVAWSTVVMTWEGRVQ